MHVTTPKRRISTLMYFSFWMHLLRAPAHHVQQTDRNQNSDSALTYIFSNLEQVWASWLHTRLIYNLPASAGAQLNQRTWLMAVACKNAVTYLFAVAVTVEPAVCRESNRLSHARSLLILATFKPGVSILQRRINYSLAFTPAVRWKEFTIEGLQRQERYFS